MTKTKIEWADRVWNPVTGCTKISQGCKNCYAERMANRFWGERKFTDVQCHEDRLAMPLHWRKPQRVFVNSVSDLFHPAVPFEFVAQIFFVMQTNPIHTFQILTKRPERMYDFSVNFLPKQWGEPVLHPALPAPNVWLGVSAENQETADERIPILLQTPAAVRFVSVEPMLGPVNLRNYLPHFCSDCGVWHSSMTCFRDEGNPKSTMIDKLNWVICGCESGPGARPFSDNWARSLKNQCVSAGVPFFFKQGRDLNGKIIKMPELGWKGRVWDQYPRREDGPNHKG